MIQSLMAVRFPSAANPSSSSAFAHYRPFWSLEDLAASGRGCHFVSRNLFTSGSCDVPWSKIRRSNKPPFLRRNLVKHKARAVAEHIGSPADPIKQNGKSFYHPFEEILESKSKNGEDVRLTAAETSRTIIEVNSKATLMFTDLISDEVHENVFLPDLLYVTDEHGNIYFQVKNEEDILQALASENSFVQIVIGFDTTEMMEEMELLGLSGIDYGVEEIEDEDTDVEDDVEEDTDDDYDEDWVAVLEDEDAEDEDEDDSDEELGDWAKLETMRTSHPMYFAKKLAEASSDDPIDWMEQPHAGVAIQGLLRPACVEEHSDIQKYKSVNQSPDDDMNRVDENAVELPKIDGHSHELESSEESSASSEDTEDEVVRKDGISYYKLDMVNIQLITAQGHQETVEVEDFKTAHPDAIAHTATKIISRLKAGGEKTTQALKSLCWRCKGIHVEEAAVIRVDSLGFDLRVCSGAQIQTLRFAFNSRATSEYGAERRVNNLLFPRIQHRPQKKKHVQQNEH